MGKVDVLSNVTDIVAKKLDCLKDPEAKGCGKLKNLSKSLSDPNGTAADAADEAKSAKEEAALAEDKANEMGAKKKLKDAKAQMAKEEHQKFLLKRADAIAKLNAAKETQTKKKLGLIESLKALEKSEEARAEEAKEEDKRALEKLKVQKNRCYVFGSRASGKELLLAGLVCPSEADFEGPSRA